MSSAQSPSSRYAGVTSPVTHSSEVEHVRDFSVEKIISVYKSELGIDVSSYFVDMSDLPLFRCKKTGYRFFYPSTVAGNETFYKKLSEEPWYYAVWKWEHDCASKIIQPGQSFLDIGCGSGMFVEGMLSRNRQGEGIDSNSSAIQHARQCGLTVHDCTLDSLISEGRSYDACCLFQVLEHIADVNDILTKTNKLLKPNGFLIIGVPNNNPYLYGFDDYNALNLPPHHIGLWDKASLKALGGEIQMELVSLRVEPFFDRRHYFRLLLNKQSWLEKVPDSTKKLAASLFEKITFPLKTFISGRNLLAVYRKPS